MKLAELICHQCGTVSYTDLPTYRMGTMPRCDCGGMRQVVRITRREPGTFEAARNADNRQGAGLR